MKALILAAGTGSRLGELGKTTPKCLLTFEEETLLSRWTRIIKQIGVTEIFVNTHHLSTIVQEEIVRLRKLYDISIKDRYEKTLLGTYETLRRVAELIDDDLIVVHCDNYSEIDLKPLLTVLHDDSPKIGIAGFRPEETFREGSGFFQMNEKCEVIGFIEKKAKHELEWANAAIFVLNRSMVKRVRESKTKFGDISRDFLPTVLDSMVLVKSRNFHQDVGTPEGIKRTQLFVKGFTNLKKDSDKTMS